MPKVNVMEEKFNKHLEDIGMTEEEYVRHIKEKCFKCKEKGTNKCSGCQELYCDDCFENHTCCFI